MTTLTANAYSLTVLLRLHADTLIWIATIVAALAGAAWLAAELGAAQTAQPAYL